jgi:hypothetical protein
VIGQADNASAQANLAGATCGGGNKHFRRGDSLPAPAVVFADPRFIESQVVQPLDQLSISLQGQGRVLAHSVNGAMNVPKVMLSVSTVMSFSCGHGNWIAAANWPVGVCS